MKTFEVVLELRAPDKATVDNYMNDLYKQNVANGPVKLLASEVRPVSEQPSAD
jgi:hypothetical protein